VVGLHNAFTYRAEHKINFNTRDRDFLPTRIDRFPVSGGAGKFLDFLEGELLPYINKTYPTNGNNTLYGHSFGGTFCLYALLTRPGLFSSYMAADPAWWWDQYALHKLAGEKLAGLAGQNRLFWFTATEGSIKGMGVDTVAALLREKAPQACTGSTPCTRTKPTCRCSSKRCTTGCATSTAATTPGSSFTP
jgi:predicted alpha/beta superfamily hydrolase